MPKTRQKGWCNKPTILQFQCLLNTENRKHGFALLFDKPGVELRMTFKQKGDGRMVKLSIPAPIMSSAKLLKTKGTDVNKTY